MERLPPDVSGPLRGPFHFMPFPQATRGLRPVRPGANSIQGRRPCTGLRPECLKQPWPELIKNGLYRTEQMRALQDEVPSFLPLGAKKNPRLTPWIIFEKNLINL
jgi:hypothetical protein